MSRGITPDGKWKWWGIFGKWYILKRIKKIDCYFEPGDWRNV